jgi:glycosyltransferase involved in cell wall biosynthesis
LYYLKYHAKKIIIGKIEKNINLLKKEELYFLSRADILIAINNKEKNILKKHFPKKKVYVIPTYVNIPSKIIKVNFEDRKDIVFFGEFHNDQNIDGITYFVDKIFPLIKLKIPYIKLHIGGHSSEIIKDYGIKDDSIVIDGFVKDIYSYLSKFRVFVCPILYSAGSKKKMLDSLMSNTPIVTFKYLAEELELKNYKEVLYVDNFKQINEFADMVVKLYNDKNLWSDISQNGYKKVISEYSEEVVAKKILNILGSL